VTPKVHQIYLVDDDKDFREATCEFLREEGLATRAFSDGETMLDTIDPEWGGIILCDIRMAGMDGFAVLKAARLAAPDVPVVMITGHGDVRLAIAAMKAGAYDFLEKPVQPDFLLSMMRRTLNARKLFVENKRLRSRMARRGGVASQLIGRSKAIKQCRKALLDLAPLPITVTLFGETGTGKSFAARILHEYGEGAGEFHTINCAALSREGFQSDLNDIDAHAATLYIRSVHKLDLKDQTLLADYLRNHGRPRVILSYTGSFATPSDQNIISDELLYLVNVATLEMPPVKDREKDIYLLLEAFLREAAVRYDKRLPNITKEMLAPLGKHDWPGNVRELRNVAERMVIGLAIDLAQRRRDDTQNNAKYDEAMLDFERNLLEQALRETSGKKGETAQNLSIPRKRLYLRMKAVGLSVSGHD
jgi:two-component system C4-dicarboxylate transport response regulator DctD